MVYGNQLKGNARKCHLQIRSGENMHGNIQVHHRLKAAITKGYQELIQIVNRVLKTTLIKHVAKQGQKLRPMQGKHPF